MARVACSSNDVPSSSTTSTSGSWPMIVTKPRPSLETSRLWFASATAFAMADFGVQYGLSIQSRRTSGLASLRSSPSASARSIEYRDISSCASACG